MTYRSLNTPSYYNDPTPPPCVQCRQREHMVLENSSLTERRWHCKACLNKTTEKTAFGIIAPTLSVVAIIFGLGDIFGS